MVRRPQTKGITMAKSTAIATVQDVRSELDEAIEAAFVAVRRASEIRGRADVELNFDEALNADMRLGMLAAFYDGGLNSHGQSY